MDTWQRRTLLSLGGLAAAILGYAVLYQAGMAAFEPEPRPTFLHSLQVAVETFTTTGFGSDSPWISPQMNLLVILMDLTGVALIFLALPVLVFPLLEESLSSSPPTALDLEGHVLICPHTSLADTLASELDSWEVPHAIVEPDRDRATDLYEEGRRVVHADPESPEDLERAAAGEARAVVADTSERDTSIILAAGEAAENTPVYSVVDAPGDATYHELAGADGVFTPRTPMAHGLSDKVATSPGELTEGIELGEEFEVAELPVARDSDLAGTTLADSEVDDGVTIIGAWRWGHFETPPDPTTRIDRGTVLLVAGAAAAVEGLHSRTRSRAHRHEHREVLIAGYGEVGRTVAADLEDTATEYTVVDVREMEGVDVVGDATDPDTLREAGIEGADAFVLALADDTDTEFATLVARDVAPDIEIVVRVEDADSVAKTYRAGADYVIALATVSGRMVASAVIENERALSVARQVRIVEVAADGLIGRTLGGAEVRTETGCTVLAVEREGELVTDLGPEFRIAAGDELVVAGTDKNVRRFNERMN